LSVLVLPFLLMNLLSAVTNPLLHCPSVLTFSVETETSDLSNRTIRF
jgi:hypothetical protein